MTFFDFLLSPATLAPLIVGSLFLSIGLNRLLHHCRFKNTASHISGTVKAIEKYTSTHSSGTQRQKTTYFRPIVSYLYNGEERTVAGYGVNEIRHKLNQNVPVMIRVSDDGEHIQAAVNDPLDHLVSFFFLVMGLIALGVYVIGMGGAWTAALVIAATAIGMGHIVSTMMLNFENKVIQEDTPEPHEDAILIETQADYIKEISSHALWGNVIALFFLACATGIMYMGYNDLPKSAITQLNNDFSAFSNLLIAGDMPSSWEKPLMILGIGVFFFLASLRSLFYIRKKYGGFLRL